MTRGERMLIQVEYELDEDALSRQKERANHAKIRYNQLFDETAKDFSSKAFSARDRALEKFSRVATERVHQRGFLRFLDFRLPWFPRILPGSERE